MQTNISLRDMQFSHFSFRLLFAITIISHQMISLHFYLVSDAGACNLRASQTSAWIHTVNLSHRTNSLTLKGDDDDIYRSFKLSSAFFAYKSSSQSEL